MLKIISLFICLVIINVNGYAQSWQWANSGQGNDFDAVERMTIDKYGNTYVIGSFYDVLTIDTFHLVSHGFKDVFWAKFDKYGQIVWAKSTGGKGNDLPGGIAVNNSNQVYVFLSFIDTISDSQFQVRDTGWENDLLLAKYDSSGNLQMYKTWGSTYRDRGTSITVDNMGHIYLFGAFSDYSGSPAPSVTIDFDGNILNSFGGRDAFIVKLDSSLITLWAKGAGGLAADFPNKVSIDEDYNVVIVGQAPYGINFDSIQISDPDLVFFVAKYDSSGNALWAKMATTDLLGSYGISCATGKNGSVYCAGTYDTPFNISSVSRIKFGNTTLTGDYAFLVKYDANGNLQWAKNLGQTARDAAYDIAVDSMDNLYVTGTFNYTGIFGNDTFYTVGHDDIFVNKYDSNGNHIWTVTAGGVTNDGAYAIALDKDNDIHIGGYISSSPAYFGSYEVSSAGAWDMCVAKLHQYPTGVPELSSFTNEVHVYPNPNAGTFLLDYGDKQYEKLSITDISGREVYHKHISGSTKQQINLNLSDGVYLIRLTGKDQSAVQKFIVQH
ncbi:MAG TPA: T9SS type A sorting domain-containing protein [Flavipsychrobacter sp.]|nr:T9SS type A sorting domain-containing protein [Flavipsychrobacter sp.]